MEGCPICGAHHSISVGDDGLARCRYGGYICVPGQHEFEVVNFSTSLGFTARCTCGLRIMRATGVNGPGRRYSLQTARERWSQHITEVLRDRAPNASILEAAS